MNEPQPRFHAIDHLRAVMILIVVFGHALLPYTTIPRKFNDPQVHIGFDALAVFLYGFAMPVFFVTAGFSTALIFYRKGTRALWRNRFLRLFVPLLLAYLVLTPLTRAAYKFAKHAAESGSIQTGLEMLANSHWLSWGKVYHLWFLASLIVFSAMALALRGIVRQAGLADFAQRASRRLLESPFRAAILALILAATMAPAYAIYGADATTLPMQLTLFASFLIGWLLYLHRDLLTTLSARPQLSIAIALAVLPIAVWSTRLQLLSSDSVQWTTGIIAGLSNSVLAAFMIFAMVEIFQARYDQSSKLGRYISDASYWLYLLHYPLLIAVAGALSVSALPAVLKYLLTVSLVVPVLFASYQLVRKLPSRAAAR
ncbi:MAG: acyltransferase family protein [Pseudomonadota bacterium]